MQSFFANLRSLVLPFGGVTGSRIVIDGTIGTITIYDGANIARVLLANSSPEVTIADGNGNTIWTISDSTTTVNRYLTAPTVGMLALRSQGFPVQTERIVDARSNTDSIAPFAMFGSGRMEWGAGGNASRDVVFQRDAAAHVALTGGLSTTGNVTVGGTLTAGLTTLDGANFTGLQMAGGSTVGTTNGSGDYNLLGVIITATGWTNVHRLQVWNGDGNSRANITLALMAGLPASTGNVRAWIASAGTAMINTNFRYEWFAWGA
jgi:hypothetical protein